MSKIGTVVQKIFEMKHFQQMVNVIAQMQPRNDQIKVIDNIVALQKKDKMERPTKCTSFNFKTPEVSSTCDTMGR